VSFFLAHAGRGRIGKLPAGMEIEVAAAQWLPLDDASRILAYSGEREMAEKARQQLGAGSGPRGSDPI
jgi:hypothetical protein